MSSEGQESGSEVPPTLGTACEPSSRRVSECIGIGNDPAEPERPHPGGSSVTR